MLKMSFYDGTLDRKELIHFINKTNKTIKYTFGLLYRDPATKYKPISKQEAIAIANNADLLDAEEREDFLHLNAYHINDMY